MKVYCEDSFIGIANELLQLVQSSASFSVYRYEFLSSAGDESRFKVYANYEIGEEKYRPNALLTVNKDKVCLKKKSWQLRGINSLRFVLSVQFGAQQPETPEDLIRYLARYPFIAEITG